MEGTIKTILIKQGLMENAMDRYCLLKEVASLVIQDIHPSQMHINIDGIVQQAQKFV